MKIIHIETQKSVRKTKKELEEELKTIKPNSVWFSEYKSVPMKEPIYIVEMSMEELKLVSFYLELENRKPIMNVEIDAELKKGDKL